MNTTSNMVHIPPLIQHRINSLRCISVLLIYLGHAFLIKYHFLAHGTTDQPSQRVYVARQFFMNLQHMQTSLLFMLSSCVLTLIYTQQTTFRLTMRQLVWRRLVRLAPLHLCIMCIMAILLSVLSWLHVELPVPLQLRFSVDAFFIKLFMLDVIMPFYAMTWNAVSWFSSSLIFFTLFLPTVFKWLSRQKHWHCLLLPPTVLLAQWVLLLSLPLNSTNLLQYGLQTHPLLVDAINYSVIGFWPSYVCGIVLALTVIKAQHDCHCYGRVDIIGTIILVLAYFVPYDYSILMRVCIAPVLQCALLQASLFGHYGFAEKIVDNPLIRLVSPLSYAFYLNHFFILMLLTFVFDDSLNLLTIIIIGLPITLLLAYCAERWIVKPLYEKFK